METLTKSVGFRNSSVHFVLEKMHLKSSLFYKLYAELAETTNIVIERIVISLVILVDINDICRLFEFNLSFVALR